MKCLSLFKEFEHGPIRQGLFKVGNEDGTISFLDAKMNVTISVTQGGAYDFSSDGIVVANGENGVYFIKVK